MQYIADNGTPITDDMVDRWADEAERAFEGCEAIPFEGRAWEENGALKPRTVRFSDAQWSAIKRAAAGTGDTPGEYIRQAALDKAAEAAAV